LGQLNTQHQLIFGQLDVFLLSCFLARFVSVLSYLLFPTDVFSAMIS
jgi:hypothetical protein